MKGWIFSVRIVEEVCRFFFVELSNITFYCLCGVRFYVGRAKREYSPYKSVRFSCSHRNVLWAYILFRRQNSIVKYK